jgi:hypothetical protein
MSQGQVEHLLGLVERLQKLQLSESKTLTSVCMFSLGLSDVLTKTLELIFEMKPRQRKKLLPVALKLQGTLLEFSKEDFVSGKPRVHNDEEIVLKVMRRFKDDFNHIGSYDHYPANPQMHTLILDGRVDVTTDELEAFFRVVGFR